MTQKDFGGLDFESIVNLMMKGLRAGVRGLNMNLTVPLTGYVTLSKSLNLPKATAKC